MIYTNTQIWTIIILLGIGTYLIRTSFLLIWGNRPLPAWVIQHLRYTAVAILPGLVAPLVLWPAATGGEPDLARGIAAIVTFALAYKTRNVVIAVLGGAVTLGVILALVD